MDWNGEARGAPRPGLLEPPQRQLDPLRAMLAVPDPAIAESARTGIVEGEADLDLDDDDEEDAESAEGNPVFGQN